MAVSLEQKKSIVDSLVADLKDSSAVYLIDYSGIKVIDDNAFRQRLAEKNIVYRAAKNTLLKRAFAEMGVEGLDEHLVGVSAIMIGDSEAPMMPAKELVEFLKEKEDALTVKVINFDGEIMSGDKLKDVSKMPGRQELIAQIVNLALSPASNLVNAFSGPGATVVSQISSKSEEA